MMRGERIHFVLLCYTWIVPEDQDEPLVTSSPTSLAVVNTEDQDALQITSSSTSLAVVNTDDDHIQSLEVQPVSTEMGLVGGVVRPKPVAICVFTQQELDDPQRQYAWEQSSTLALTPSSTSRGTWIAASHCPDRTQSSTPSRGLRRF